MKTSLKSILLFVIATTYQFSTFIQKKSPNVSNTLLANPILKISIITVGLICFTSCKKDKIKFEKELYEATGELHNEGCQFVLNNVLGDLNRQGISLKDLTKQEIVDRVDALTKIYIQRLDFTESEINNAIKIYEEQAELFNRDLILGIDNQRNYSNYLSNSLSVDENELLTELMETIDDYENKSSFHEELDKLNLRAQEKLNSEELAVFLHGSYTARYSIPFWEENLASFSTQSGLNNNFVNEEFIFYKAKESTAKEVGTSDVSGAVGGAVGGCVAGALGAGAGCVAVGGVAAVTMGLGSSVKVVAEKIIDWLSLQESLAYPKPTDINFVHFSGYNPQAPCYSGPGVCISVCEPFQRGCSDGFLNTDEAQASANFDGKNIFINIEEYNFSSSIGTQLFEEKVFEVQQSYPLNKQFTDVVLAGCALPSHEQIIVEEGNYTVLLSDNVALIEIPVKNNPVVENLIIKFSD